MSNIYFPSSDIMTKEWTQLSFDFDDWWKHDIAPWWENDIGIPYIAWEITDENRDYFPPFDPNTYSSEYEKEQNEALLDVLQPGLVLSQQTVDETKEGALSTLSASFSLYNTLHRYTQQKVDFFPSITKSIKETCFFEEKHLVLINHFFSTYLEQMFYNVSSHSSNKEFSEKTLHKFSDNILTKTFFRLPNILPKTLKARRNLFWEKFRTKILWNKDSKKSYDPGLKKYQF